MAEKIPTAEFFRTELLPKHAQRVPEAFRADFTRIAQSLADTHDASSRDFAAKLRTGIYQGPAREYLAATLRDEARQMFDITEKGMLSGVRDNLDALRATASKVPQNIGHEVAREIRDVLRAMKKDDRENAVALSTDPDVAAAVLNAPGGGFGINLSDNAKQRLLENYNRAHRADLLQRINDAEAVIAAVEEARRTLSASLLEILR